MHLHDGVPGAQTLMNTKGKIFFYIAALRVSLANLRDFELHRLVKEAIAENANPSR